MANVVLTRWLSSAGIAALLEMSAVALAAYGTGAPQGLTNKIFEYLSAGVPILSSLRGETERLLAGEDCGLTYQAGSARDFAAGLEQLRDGNRRCRMGDNGRHCFEAQFSSPAIYDGLARHLERVATSRRESYLWSQGD